MSLHYPTAYDNQASEESYIMTPMGLCLVNRLCHSKNPCHGLLDIIKDMPLVSPYGFL